MRKLFSTIILSMLCLFSLAQEITVKHNLPESVKAGESINVEVTINKGGVAGFARFQCDVPVGFTATEVESKGAKFTFENSRVKMVWTSLPNDPTYVVKFKIDVPVNALTECIIGAKFSYIEGGVKKEIDIPNHKLTIGGGGSVAATTPVETKTETKTEPVASTTEADAKAKADEEAKMREEMKRKEEEAMAAAAAKKKAEEEAAMAAKKKAEEEAALAAKKEEKKVKTETTPIEAHVKELDKKATAKAGVTDAAHHKVVPGTEYVIQLGAYATKPAKSKFASVGGPVEIVQEDGMYKVLTGSYDNIHDAQLRKAELIAHGFNCFMVTYKDGVRVK